MHTDSHLLAISPDGVPVGTAVPAIRKFGNKTDFTTIFSSIKSFKAHKPPRGLLERDTVTAPQYFEETFGPINAASNANGVSYMLPCSDL